MLALIALAAVLAAAAPDRHKEAAALLDEMNAASAAPDESRYFSLFTPDAVFLGTDPAERWTVAEFRAWARPRFEKGRGWTFKPLQRNIFFSPDGNVAWFDEDLDVPGLGRCRGTGVLVRRAGRFRIAQYNLSVPVPNELLKEIRQRIDELKPK